MALVLKDRVVETTDVAGTGSASLLGAQDGYQAFSVIGNGNTTYYTIYDPVAFDWEVGIGTYASSGNVLARTTVLASSNSGSLVAFGSGTKDIFLDLPSEKVVALGALTYQGTWNATTNVPTLASSTGTQGYYYVVSVAGSTNLNGITDWQVGDWAIYNGTAWQKIDNTDAVSSVNGQTGTVVLTYSDVGAQVAGTYVTSVSGTAPVASSGGTTPAISMAKATGSVDGYLSSTDWSTFNGKQPAFGSQTANYVYAAPNGSAGVPSFRALVTTDIPSLSGSYIPYTGASSAVDLNAKTLVNIANLGVGTATVPTILARVVGDNNSTSRIAMRGYSSDANSSSIRVSKYRGTVASPQAPLSGDSLGKFELAGYGTTSSDGYAQASFEGVATEIWSAVARGTKALIKVTPNTTINQVTAVTIDQDLSVTAAGALTVTGHTTFEGVTSTGATGTGKLVYDTSPTLVTPALGTPSALVGTNITGTASGLSIGGNAATATTAGTVTTNANLTGMVTSVGNATTVVTNANLTGAVTSVGNATSLGSFTSANLAGALTDETGSGSAVFATSPTLVTPALGIPASGTLTNCTGLPNAGLVNSAITINGTSTALGSSISVGTVTSVTGTSPIASSGGATPAISISQATTSTNGYLSSTDWNTFNNKGSGTVTSVTGTAPVVSSGGATPAISMVAATTSVSGYLTSTDWTTFNGKYSTGGALGTPSSGTLTNCTADGTDQVGFKNIPQNSQSAAYTLVLADAGKHIYHPASDANVRTFTIPAASSVAYPIGTAITFVNLSASVVTIAITTDTMYLSSAGTTGSRSLAQYGTATALKVSGLSSAGIWVISGSGLT